MIGLAEVFEPLRVAVAQTGIRSAVGGSWASTAFGEPRFTNDVHILAELTLENVAEFLTSTERIPFVTAEDILPSKLYWFWLGGEVSGTQCDVEGL